MTCDNARNNLVAWWNSEQLEKKHNESVSKAMVTATTNMATVGTLSVMVISMHALVSACCLLLAVYLCVLAITRAVLLAFLRLGMEFPCRVLLDFYDAPESPAASDTVRCS